MKLEMLKEHQGVLTAQVHFGWHWDRELVPPAVAFSCDLVWHRVVAAEKM